MMHVRVQGKDFPFSLFSLSVHTICKTFVPHTCVMSATTPGNDDAELHTQQSTQQSLTTISPVADGAQQRNWRHTAKTVAGRVGYDILIYCTLLKQHLHMMHSHHCPIPFIPRSATTHPPQSLLHQALSSPGVSRCPHHCTCMARSRGCCIKCHGMQTPSMHPPPEVAVSTSHPLRHPPPEDTLRLTLSKTHYTSLHPPSTSRLQTPRFCSLLLFV